MKKIALSLLALTALTTASYAAGNRSWDLRDRQYYTPSAVPNSSTSNSNAMTYTMAEPFAVASTDEHAMGAFDRMNLRAWQRNHGGR